MFYKSGIQRSRWPWSQQQEPKDSAYHCLIFIFIISYSQASCFMILTNCLKYLNLGEVFCALVKMPPGMPMTGTGGLELGPDTPLKFSCLIIFTLGGSSHVKYFGFGHSCGNSALNSGILALACDIFQRDYVIYPIRNVTENKLSNIYSLPMRKYFSMISKLFISSFVIKIY